MPLFEYDCGDCGNRSYHVMMPAEVNAGDLIPSTIDCDHCPGEADRALSQFKVQRTGSAGIEDRVARIDSLRTTLLGRMDRQITAATIEATGKLPK